MESYDPRARLDRHHLAAIDNAPALSDDAATVLARLANNATGQLRHGENDTRTVA